MTQMRLFELKELSMKCSRHLDAEVIHFDFLSDDYKKLAFLRADRVIEFHAQFGLLHKVRQYKLKPKDVAVMLLSYKIYRFVSQNLGGIFRTIALQQVSLPLEVVQKLGVW